MKENDKTLIWLKVGNLVFYIGVVVMNYLANALPIGGMNTGEVSKTFETLFAPAGITFSIWGVIYLLLALFVIFQFIGHGKTSRPFDTYLSRIHILFILSCLCNMLWILAWHHQRILLSLLLMIFLLISLIQIYRRLRRGADLKEAAARDKILLLAPFSIYLGWITVATIANAAALLVKAGWGGFGVSADIWTIVVLVAAIGIGVVNLQKDRDFLFGLVLIWAFTGIIIKRLSAEPVYLGIIITAGIGILILVLQIMYRLVKKK